MNEVNNRFGTLEAEVHNLGATLKLFMQQFSGQQNTAGGLGQFSGQQNTAAAGGFGQRVQFSGQQRTATPAAGGLGQEVRFSGQQEKAKERAADRERACGHLNGKWMRLESDGSMETVHFKHGLVYGGLEEAFLEYFGTDPENYFVFEYGSLLL